MKVYIIVISFVCITFSCRSEKEVEFEQYVVFGQEIYKNNCANCHGVKGEGLRNLYPKIYQSEALNNIPKLICLIKNGKQTTDGKQMPSNPRLYDLDIAQLVTYLNSAFYQKEKFVSTSEVQRALLKCGNNK